MAILEIDSNLRGAYMVYRNRDKLTILELKENEDAISFERIKDLVLAMPSNVIYCEKNGRLYGIITMGDVGRACNEGMREVAVNCKFTKLLTGEHARARKLFSEKKSINALPVTDNNGILLGDYSRWHDMIYIKNIYTLWGENTDPIKGWKIAFIKPCSAFSDEIAAYDEYCSWLREHGADVIQIAPAEVPEYVGSIKYFLTVTEDEKRAMETVYGFMLSMNEVIDRIASFANLNSIIAREEGMDYLYKIRGNVINITFCRNSGHCGKLEKDIRSKFDNVGEKVSNVLRPSMYAAFFDDLSEDGYIDSILKIKYQVINQAGLVMLKDSSGLYYNVLNGERKTLEQPQEYEKTIYFIGPCFIYGHYTEDKNTIESMIQKKINDAGYKVKVVNYGSPSYADNMELMLARIMAIPMKKGDILVTYFRNAIIPYIDNINLYDSLNQNNLNVNWVIDVPWHCNHKVNALYADAVFDKLQPLMLENVDGHGELIEHDGDYIKALYINRYFSAFDQFQYDKIGSIVMNCNPFTYGHRYLIEQALETVDFLIIFVVEEDKSFFSFDERFAMVCEGVEDLKNVLVVPSGPFILSQTSFPEYFIKTADEDLVENVENDVRVFAEKIAPHLNIKYRFVGEEPEDAVTNEYNLAMKHILPENGIELIEIPRKKIDGRYISASKVRECLFNENIEELKRLVPRSTMSVLFGD